MKNAMDLILTSKIIAIMRLNREEQIMPTLNALVAGGLTTLEIAYNTPGCLKAIQTITKKQPDLCVGVGTITNAHQTKEAIDAGAKFIVTPITKTSIVEQANKSNVPVIMGAFSPTEIHLAHEYGAAAVKLFPANYLDKTYLKAVKATLKTVKIFPTGGIKTEELDSWLKIGAAGFGVGSAIVDNKLIEKKDWHALTQKAKLFLEALRQVV